MQSLEVSGAVRLIYKSLGVKGLSNGLLHYSTTHLYAHVQLSGESLTTYAALLWFETNQSFLKGRVCEGT